MKKWSHKIGLNYTTLESDLNAYAEQGYEIFKIWRVTYDNYQIVVFKEEAILPKDNLIQK